MWKSSQAWRERAQGARTIREVGTSLLELEEGLRAHYQADSPLVDRAVWRQKIAGLHTYEGVSKTIVLLIVVLLMIVSLSMVDAGTRHSLSALLIAVHFEPLALIRSTAADQSM